MPLRARRYIGRPVMSSLVEEDAAGVLRHEAQNHAEGRRLAGPVGPQQPDDLALADLEGNVVDDLLTAGSFCEDLRLGAAISSVTT